MGYKTETAILQDSSTLVSGGGVPGRWVGVDRGRILGAWSPSSGVASPGCLAASSESGSACAAESRSAVH